MRPKEEEGEGEGGGGGGGRVCPSLLMYDSISSHTGAYPKRDVYM